MSPLILVIEDDPDTREVVAHVLEDAGYRVECAKDGADGLSRLRRGPLPSVVLLDVQMPHLSGWQVLEALQKTPGVEAVTIVLFTAASVDEARREAWAHGCVVLRKPVALDVLLSTVAECNRQAGTTESGAWPRLVT